MRKNKKWFRFVPLLLILIFIWLLDISVGLAYDYIAPKFGKQNLNLALAEYNNSTMKLRNIPHPYMTEINTPYWAENGFVQHNNLGYRDTANIEFAKDSNCIRILAIGGSTTYGITVDKPGETYPKQLEKILNDSIKKINPKYHVQVINGGMCGATSAELLNHYIFQDRYLSPDIVLIHAGVNDVQPQCFKEYSPDYSNWREIKAEGKNGLRKGEGWLINHSNIIKLLYTFWYSRLDYATSQTLISTKDFRKIKITELRENVKKNGNPGFSRNLDLLIRNILNDKVRPIFYQEYVADINNAEYFKSVLEEKDKEMYQLVEIQLFKNIETAKQTCKKYGVDYNFMPNDYIPAQNMDDICHLKVAGEFQKAEFISHRMLAEIRKIISAKLTKSQ